jgi:hypothetical protein
MIQNRSAPPDAAEATRYFLLNLDHAEVALDLVVIKGNAQITNETQHIITFVAQTSQQVVLCALFDPPPFPRGFELFWVRFQSRAKPSVVTAFQALAVGGIVGFIASLQGVFGGLFCV